LYVHVKPESLFIEKKKKLAQIDFMHWFSHVWSIFRHLVEPKLIAADVFQFQKSW